MKSSKFLKSFSNLIFLTVVLIFFQFTSSYILNNYQTGDLVSYRRYYDAIEFLNFKELFLNHHLILGASEPFYGLLMMPGKIIADDHDTYINFINLFFILSLTLLLLKKKLNFFHHHTSTNIFDGNEGFH